ERVHIAGALRGLDDDELLALRNGGPVDGAVVVLIARDVDAVDGVGARTRFLDRGRKCAEWLVFRRLTRSRHRSRQHDGERYHPSKCPTLAQRMLPEPHS